MAKVEFIGKNDWTYIVTLISVELAKYVKTVEGKGLSTEDFTTTLKNKLDELENYNDEEVRNLINGKVDKVAGKGLSTNDFTTTLLNKLNGIDLSKYSTTEQMNSAISSAIAGVTGIKFVKVDSYSALPAVGENGAIYLVPNSGTSQNIYDEYFWDGSKYELFGTTAIDLSGYLKISDIEELSTTEVKAVWDSVFGA